MWTIQEELVELKKQLDGLSQMHGQDRGVLENKLQQVMEIAEEWKKKEAIQRTNLEDVRMWVFVYACVLLSRPYTFHILVPLKKSQCT